MIIRFASADDIEAIHLLAPQIWWSSYGNILSDQQISFMLEKMYSTEALMLQMEEGITFIMAEEENRPLAFASYSVMLEICAIHKLYILPSAQGRGLGKQLIKFIEIQAKDQGAELMRLNVNRANPALGFYQNLGFEIFETVNIPYHGFLLNDYVMQKRI